MFSLGLLKTHFIDIAVAAVLFLSGLLVVFLVVGALHALSQLGPPPWWVWLALVVGLMAAFASLGVFFRRRISGLVGAASMVIATVAIMPPQPSPADFGLAGLLFITGVLTYWRFGRLPRQA
jgi:hypothetical protein